MGAGLARENKRGGGKKTQTGWHAQTRDRNLGDFKPERYAARPTAWERKVRALGLSEADAHVKVMQGHGAGLALQEFVRRIFARRYVPEVVLEAMGLQGEMHLTRALSIRDQDDGDE
jgi:hypothetical protein